jgi:hypothetical protein
MRIAHVESQTTEKAGRIGFNPLKNPVATGFSRRKQKISDSDKTRY